MGDFGECGDTGDVAPLPLPPPFLTLPRLPRSLLAAAATDLLWVDTGVLASVGGKAGGGGGAKGAASTRPDLPPAAAGDLTGEMAGCFDNLSPDLRGG